MGDRAEISHLTAEDLCHFINGGLEGCTGEPVERHLIRCEECLEALDLILLAESPPTPEEEARLRNLPSRSPEEILDQLKPLIARNAPRCSSTA